MRMLGGCSICVSVRPVGAHDRDDSIGCSKRQACDDPEICFVIDTGEQALTPLGRYYAVNSSYSGFGFVATAVLGFDG